MAEDPETQKILDDNNQLSELVHHPAWGMVKKFFVEKILELQNVAEYVDIIQTGNATKLLREMKANKRSAEILFDILRQIEGGAQVNDETPRKKEGFIVRLDED